jgi:hypothetical protein
MRVMTSRADQAKRDRPLTNAEREERDRERVAVAWQEFDSDAGKLRAALADVMDFTPRDLEAIDDLGTLARVLWARTSELKMLTRPKAKRQRRR